MNNLKRKILNLKIVDRIIEWSKVTVLPGFDQLPLYTVIDFFIREIKKESILNKASSLAYSFMLAIFPSIIFLFTLIPYIPINNFQKKLMDFLEIIIPTEAFEAIQSTLDEIINTQNGGLLSFGFLLATFFATNGMISLMRAFNKASLTKENRTWGQRRLIALSLSFSIIIAFSIGITIFTITGLVISYLKTQIAFNLSTFWTIVIKIARWITLIIIYFLTVSILYKYGPSVSKRWKLINPGATLATILAIITLSGFAYYINNFNTYNKLYGSIGTMIVIMIWMYINSLILIIGFELNASITLSKQNIIPPPQPKSHNTFKNDNNEGRE